MTSKATSGSNTQKGSRTIGFSGDEPMTGAQASYLKTLWNRPISRRLSMKASD